MPGYGREADGYAVFELGSTKVGVDSAAFGVCGNSDDDDDDDDDDAVAAVAAAEYKVVVDADSTCD